MFANVAVEMADNGNVNAVVPINSTENGASGSGCLPRRRSRAQTMQMQPPPLDNEEANGNVLHVVEDGNNVGHLVKQAYVHVPMEMVRGDDAADAAATANANEPLEQNGETLPLAVIQEENEENIDPLAVNDSGIKDENDEDIEPLAVCDAAIKEEIGENIDPLAVSEAGIKEENDEDIEPLAVCDAVIKEENDENIEPFAIRNAVIKEEYVENFEPLAVRNADINRPSTSSANRRHGKFDLLAAAMNSANIKTVNEEDNAVNEAANESFEVDGAVGGGVAIDLEIIEISSEEDNAGDDEIDAASVDASDDDIPVVTLEYFLHEITDN